MAKNIFNSILLPNVSTNNFDLSHDVKMSFQMGKLIPTTAFEVLPGDKFTISPHTMLRFAPLIAPVMHKVRVRTEFFFVPNRILWPEWEKWITGDLVDVEHPYVPMSDSYTSSGPMAYMGVPPGIANSININPMPSAAYRLIFDEYYRDQNLVETRFVPLVSGDNTTNYGPGSDYEIDCQRRAWVHDYLTGCLPFAQKGVAVQVPLVTQDDIPVELNLAAGDPATFKTQAGVVLADGPVLQDGGVARVDTGSPTNALYDPQGSLTVDVQAGATDINTLRLAFRVQEWLERNARGGTRYIESILSHFGVRSDDARLQRPEYIGGSVQNMVISEVLSTAQTLETGDAIANPVGQMAGHGISVGGGNTFKYKATEHGWILGIISVCPDTAYQDGVPKQFLRQDRFDYAWPSFANLGEQPVVMAEVYADSTTPTNTFGYAPRYAEYKFLNSRVAGEMRDSLSMWHFGRKFDSEPALNAQFIQCVPRTDPFAVIDPNVDHIYCHIVNRISAVRKLPRYGIPKI